MGKPGLDVRGFTDKVAEHLLRRRLIGAQRHAAQDAVGIAEFAIPLARLLAHLAGTGVAFLDALAVGVDVYHDLRLDEMGHDAVILSISPDAAVPDPGQP